MKSTGTVNMGAEVPFTWDLTWQSPKQLKLVAELGAVGMAIPGMEAKKKPGIKNDAGLLRISRS